MRVSLVVTVKDEAPAIQRLIDGVRAQTRAPEEWIVVDGGSRDSTPALLAEVGECQLLQHPGNIAAGRNHGVAAASGEIIVMTDAGCDLPPGWLASLVAPFHEAVGDGAVAWVGGATRPRLRRAFDLVQWALLDQLNFRAQRRRAPRFSCRSIAFRRSLWESTPFPEWLEHGEDAWTFACWARQGHRAAVQEAPAVRWDMRADLAGFWLQHLRYMRGDGTARMRRLSHSLRLGFYAALTVAVLGAVVLAQPRWLALPLAAWLAYLSLNAVRLVQVVVRERRWRWLLPCLLWLPGMLLLLDAAKAFGFLSGLLAPRSSARQIAA